MWEVFSCGTTPYVGMSNSVAREQIESGEPMLYGKSSTFSTTEMDLLVVTNVYNYENEDGKDLQV